VNDAGVEGPADHWGVDRIGETRLHRILSDPGFIDARMQGLTLTPGPLSGPAVPCARLVYAFPNLTQLTVHGVMGRLEDAGALNKLRSLISLDLDEVFGMSAQDCLDPSRMARLEHIELRNVPEDYADAMRRAWKPHTKRGVYLSISGARKPEWVAQNMANPLRGWDGREGISSRAYAKARAAWNQSTPSILAALTEDLTEDARRERLEQLGAQFAEAFDAVNLRSGFIETYERDELLDGLANLVGAAPTAAGVDVQDAIDTLLHAVNQTRGW
jgi:hypothetical protein